MKFVGVLVRRATLLVDFTCWFVVFTVLIWFWYCFCVLKFFWTCFGMYRVEFVCFGLCRIWIRVSGIQLWPLWHSFELVHFPSFSYGIPFVSIYCCRHGTRHRQLTQTPNTALIADTDTEYDTDIEHDTYGWHRHWTRHWRLTQSPNTTLTVDTAMFTPIIIRKNDKIWMQSMCQCRVGVDTDMCHTRPGSFRSVHATKFFNHWCHHATLVGSGARIFSSNGWVS